MRRYSHVIAILLTISSLVTTGHARGKEIRDERRINDLFSSKKVSKISELNRAARRLMVRTK